MCPNLERLGEHTNISSNTTRVCAGDVTINTPRVCAGHVTVNISTAQISTQSRDGRFGSKVAHIGSQIGQIRDFFRSDLPNVLKSDLKKSRICPIMGPI